MTSVRKFAATMTCYVMCLLACLQSTARANDLGYSVDFSLDLWLIDFTAGTANLVGNTGLTGTIVEGIALRSDGTLFATTSSGDLFTIDTTTAASTFVGTTGLGNIEALDFNGNDLLGVNFLSTPSVYSLNQSNAAPSLVATANSSTGAVRSGTLLDASTMLVRGDNGGNTLYSIALAGGATSTIGVMPSTVFGMDFLGSTLYGVDADGRLYNINPGTGGMTQIGDTGSQTYLSLAMINPIPEPSSLALAMLGGAAFVGFAIKRRRG